MKLQSGIFRRFLCVLVAGVALAGSAAAQGIPASAEAIADYQKKLAIYNREFAKFDEIAAPYWTQISDKRRKRFAKRRAGEAVGLDDYVLTQPPLYTGPPKPSDPTTGRPERKPVPVAADFLRNADEQFNFTPQRPQSEVIYKRTYAKVASAAGLTKDQIVRVYSFESGGNGNYDVQAGLEYSKNGRAISTALGYNQLLHTNSVEVVAEEGHDFLKALEQKSNGLRGADHDRLEGKLAIFRRMLAFTRSVPNQWSEHEKLAVTPKGLGVHSITLDIDIGPYAQTQKLLTSVNFARMKGVKRPLTAAELEMMNLTGDGNGFDMVTMPDDIRAKVPTSNFFQRGGYERNPVAIRNNTVKALLAATDSKMDGEGKLQGARDMADAYDQVVLR